VDIVDLNMNDRSIVCGHNCDNYADRTRKMGGRGRRDEEGRREPSHRPREGDNVRMCEGENLAVAQAFFDQRLGDERGEERRKKRER
jgi:hypothetical protein